MINGRKVLFLIVAALVGLALIGSPAGAQAASGKVKVFILAGQSNMEGKAPNTLLDYQAEDPKTRDFFKHLRKDGKWIVRDDVFIKYLDRKGPLTIGYGSPGRTGVELEFGTMMGDHFDEPVLLIKAAWGGHSLVKLFRSPSAGYPADIQKELEQAQDRVKKDNEKNKRNNPIPTMEDIKKPYGSSYRNMLAEVKETFDNYETMFPELKGRKLELAGFVWFQGWNDMYGGAENEYASNMKHFIKDVRKDLGAPNLPFVIAAMGQNGSKPAAGAMLTVREAQMSMNDVPEFKGNVKAFRTDVLVDKAAEDLYPTWSKDVELWKKTGGDRGYHYLGSAIWFTRIGEAMGRAMAAMVGSKKASGAQDAGPLPEGLDETTVSRNLRPALGALSHRNYWAVEPMLDRLEKANQQLQAKPNADQAILQAELQAIQTIRAFVDEQVTGAFERIKSYVSAGNLYRAKQLVIEYNRYFRGIEKYETPIAKLQQAFLKDPYKTTIQQGAQFYQLLANAQRVRTPRTIDLLAKFAERVGDTAYGKAANAAVAALNKDPKVELDGDTLVAGDQ